MVNKRFNKILIANRGEIALRIIKAVQSLGKKAVVVYAYDDRDLPFVEKADEAYSLGSGTLATTYLDGKKIIRIARESGADAIHPGYGFLAENSEFASLCEKEGITFIGPSPEVIAIMGDKSRAREKAKELGLPLLTGFSGEASDLLANAENYPYPILIKPSAGGGGKGMRIVKCKEEFEEAANEAAREALNYFGSSALYVEQYLHHPRHIEVQVLADLHGNAVHLFERECSIQRRYQKIIEEAPSISISPEIRKNICKSALKLVDGTSYTNAGTVEFLLDDTGAFFFLEMNTRIQVEHPVTEKITGIDLVMEQIKIAEGKPLSFEQEDIQIKGHSIEARIYAERPGQGFLPSSGSIQKFQLPREEDIRIDYAYGVGNKVAPFYDPMIAKVIVLGTNRQEAINKLTVSLKDFHITGISTNRDYLIFFLKAPLFAQNQIHTKIVEQEFDSIWQDYLLSRDKFSPDILVAAAAIFALQAEEPERTKEASIWEQIGHWRLLPQMSLLYQDKPYKVEYNHTGDRKKLRLKINEKKFEINLENQHGDSCKMRINNQILQLRASSLQSEILLDIDGHMYTIRRPDIADDRYQDQATNKNNQKSDRILAPLNGRIIKINHREGEKIEKGQALLLIESMKMENKILAPFRSIIKKAHVSEGDLVHNNQLLFTLDINDRSTDHRKTPGP